MSPPPTTSADLRRVVCHLAFVRPKKSRITNTTQPAAHPPPYIEIKLDDIPPNDEAHPEIPTPPPAYSARASQLEYQQGGYRPVARPQITPMTSRGTCWSWKSMTQIDWFFWGSMGGLTFMMVMLAVFL